MTINQDPENPIERGVLAQAIVKISDAAVALKRDGLNEKAIIVLLADRTRLARGTLKEVLDGLRDLKREYCS